MKKTGILSIDPAAQAPQIGAPLTPETIAKGAGYEKLPEEASSVAENPEDTSIQAIALHLIEDNPYNSRFVYNEDYIKSLALSLAKGQQNPIAVIPHPAQPGRFIGLTGKRRRLAMEYLKGRDGTIEARVLQVTDPKEYFRIAFDENTEREQQYDIDNGLALAKLLADKVYASRSELAKVIRRDAGYISRALTFAKFPEPVLSIMKEYPEKFTVVFAAEIHQVLEKAGQDAAMELTELIARNDMSFRDVVRRKEQMIGDQVRKPRNNARSYPIEAKGQSIGIFKEWNNGKVLLEMGALSEQSRIKLRHFLQELVEAEAPPADKE